MPFYIDGYHLKPKWVVARGVPNPIDGGWKGIENSGSVNHLLQAKHRFLQELSPDMVLDDGAMAGASLGLPVYPAWEGKGFSNDAFWRHLWSKAPRRSDEIALVVAGCLAENNALSTAK